MKKCKDCGGPRNHNNALISRCKKCTYKRSEANPKQTRIKMVSDKKKKRLQENGTEGDMFKRIWKKRPHLCQICGIPIRDPAAYCFAHILSKKMYPMLRYFENNINIVCSIECHEETDRRLSGQNKEEIKQRILNGDTINI